MAEGCMARPKIMIDRDPGHDDAVAILAPGGIAVPAPNAHVAVASDARRLVDGVADTLMSYR